MQAAVQAAVQVPLAHSNLQLATAEVVGLEVRGGVRHDLDRERRGQYNWEHNWGHMYLQAHSPHNHIAT